MRTMKDNVQKAKEEVTKLVLRAQRGCEEAKNELTKAYERKVYSIVQKYNLQKDYDDAIQCGMVGLAKAIVYYDPKVASFSTYVEQKVKGELRHYFRDNNSVYLPRKITDNYLKIKNFIEEYNEKYGNEPTAKEIMEGTDLPKEEYELAVNAKASCISLHHSSKSQRGDKVVSILDTITDIENPYESVELSHYLEKVTRKELNKTERMVLYLRYTKEMTQIEVAKLIGTNQGSICRTEKRALAKLKEKIDKKAI
ncbi:hypothetical protein CN918_26270 [Priestia megaterium]|nr:hypothetical protein CN918_26270 [Priestia megaterium]